MDSLNHGAYEHWHELLRVLPEKAVPFDVRIPNAETQAAMRDVQEGKVKRFDSVDALMADLNDDED